MGMKIAWVLPDGIRRNRKIMQMSSTLPTLKMTNDDAAFIGQFLTSIKKSFMDKIMANQQFFADMILLVNSDKPLPMKQFTNFCTESTSKSLHSIPGFEKLNGQDQSALIKSNNGMLTVFKQASNLDETEWGINKGVEEAMKSGEYEALTAAR